MKKENKGLNEKDEKELKRIQRVDFKTWLYLKITNAKIVVHPEVSNIDNIRKMDVNDNNENEVYVFNNYDEYKNFFLMYLNSIEEYVIDLAIYTRGNDGKIIALKGLCEYIIVKKAVEEFYNSITQEQIDDIHSRGKITSLEKVEECENLGLCAPGDAIGSANSRCNYFSNCHECLLEYYSHCLEYNTISYYFKLVNTDDKEGRVKQRSIKE